MNLALFDFDGTITNEDTFSKFIFFATPKSRLFFGLFLLFPVIFLYKLRVVKAPTIRPLISRVAFFSRSEEQISKLANEFVDSYLPCVIQECALEKIKWHKQNNDTVVVVSANVDILLRRWSQSHGLSLLSSKLEVRNGNLTGRYLNGDCSGQNKVAEIESAIDLTSFAKIFAYGDTPEDLPMLNLADIRYYKWQKM